MLKPFSFAMYFRAWRPLVLVATCFWLTTACRQSGPAAGPEENDATFERGRALLKQGREREALAAFLKVIDERGNQAPESHLDVAILYQEHIKDPIAAIYHYRKYLELKPNSRKQDLVNQRIDAATREFASRLPAQPMENQVMRKDLLEVAEKLQRENNQLRQQLNVARNNFGAPSSGANEPMAASSPGLSRPTSGGGMSITAAPLQPTVMPPPEVAPARQQAPAAPKGRTHVVEKGDTLSNLASKYYSDRSRYKEIFEANRDVLNSPNDLKLGMTLRIP